MTEENKENIGFFKRLVSGLSKTRDNIVSGMDSIFNGFSHIDDEFYEELEEVLIMGDLGVQATYDILDELAEKWSSLTDIQQASVTELIAGGQNLASIYRNINKRTYLIARAA